MSVINTNITSMIGQQNLNASKSALTTSMERLSSGLRINSAKDDAAGQAIANRMSAQITGLSTAQRNANDGISVAQTAEGALNQVNDNLQRVRELTVQAQNGTNSDSDLESIQNEINERLNEIHRVTEQTEFNGEAILNGAGDVTIQVGANDGQAINIELGDKGLTADGGRLGSLFKTEGGSRVANFVISGSGFDTSKVAAAASSDGYVGENVTFNIQADTDTNSTAPKTAEGIYALKDGSGYVVKASDGTYETANVATDGTVNWDSDAADVTAANVDTAGGALESGSLSKAFIADGSGLDDSGNVYAYDGGEGAPEYVIKDSSSGTDRYYEVSIDVEGRVTRGEELKADQAMNTTDPLKTLDNALKEVDSLRSNLGAIQNRFETAINNMATTETNLSAARSRIEDADYAVEVANMTRAQILQQAGTSVLAQANQVPQSVLSLLG
ncbi:MULTISPECIES: FliC/FljB family flagellin [unclassified Halomonas]|uniref:FliC/FljB family flagellin n=1 Tax=unclassified Halomonas TaxID=2609666 RepID=UPI001C94C7D2|nr:MULTISPECIES: FliC/FljB family flagellin [unclassified Halomonas]MBY5924932.1 FliC/FljB family flagellin [Halomonas sp. DP4Y7-2]MBY6231973.1 FliC/FljB family flagellin [Halomonas sp. DP4Y7-1]